MNKKLSCPTCGHSHREGVRCVMPGNDWYDDDDDDDDGGLPSTCDCTVGISRTPNSEIEDRLSLTLEDRRGHLLNGE